MLQPSEEETARREKVLSAIKEAIESNTSIKLPAFDRVTRPQPTLSLYAGTVGPYSYQFEGEEDLLHLIVTRQDGSPLTPEDGQQVALFLLANLPPGLIWIKPGELSQHFYCGHDDLLKTI